MQSAMHRYIGAIRVHEQGCTTLTGSMKLKVDYLRDVFFELGRRQAVSLSAESGVLPAVRSLLGCQTEKVLKPEWRVSTEQQVSQLALNTDGNVGTVILLSDLAKAGHRVLRCKCPQGS